jgi:hypothetical protein
LSSQYVAIRARNAPLDSPAAWAAVLSRGLDVAAMIPEKAQRSLTVAQLTLESRGGLHVSA